MVGRHLDRVATGGQRVGISGKPCLTTHLKYKQRMRTGVLSDAAVRRDNPAFLSQSFQDPSARGVQTETRRDETHGTCDKETAHSVL